MEEILLGRRLKRLCKWGDRRDRVKRESEEMLLS